MAGLTDSQRAEIRAAHQLHIRGIAVMVFVTYWLVVLTYQDFFLFNPNEAGDAVRQASLWLCLIGWILAAVGTPVGLFAAASGSMFGLRILPVTALLWPVAILVSQVTIYIERGQSYADYLFNYPIFILTDIAIPIFVLLKWSQMWESIRNAN